VDLTGHVVLHRLMICYFYVIGLQRLDGCYPLPGWKEDYENVVL
jgi:hypothetical protein